MQKVYLLLRNNQQTGPHSLDELIRLNLKPFDLIWVEGKSSGWSYPSEIEALKPFLAAATATATSETAFAPNSNQPQPPPSVSKKIFVSLPVNRAASLGSPPAFSAADPIEKKAEELRQRIQSYAAQKPLDTLDNDELRTNYARSLNKVEEDYTTWMYHKKTEKSRTIGKKHLAIAGITIVGLVAGWLAAGYLFKQPESKALLVTVQNKPAGSVAKAFETKEPASPAFPTPPEPVKPSATNSGVKKSEDKKEKPAVGKKAETVKTPVAEVAAKEVLPPAHEAPPMVEPTAGSAPPAPEAPREKKKSLKQILGGLFKKRKEETAREESKAAEETNKDRNATHRSEPATATLDLSDQVDIKTNQNSEDWMMGIQGLKLTLYNRSAATLKNAAVDVLYYSEQNELLDKKTVYFSNVEAKKSQTLAAPDHRLADHVGYKIISASGVMDAYAKQ